MSRQFEGLIVEATTLRRGKRMGTPISLSMRYTNPLWHEYNRGLVHLTDPGRGTGPHIAPGCGHFIQRDVTYVVKAILDLMQEIR